METVIGIVAAVIIGAAIIFLLQKKNKTKKTLPTAPEDLNIDLSGKDDKYSNPEPIIKVPGQEPIKHKPLVDVKVQEQPVKKKLAPAKTVSAADLSFLEDMTKAELLAWAAENNIPVTKSANKAKIKEAIKSAKK